MKVTRWTSYDDDRLLVRGDDGEDIGWWDLKAMEPHLLLTGRPDALARAIAEWQAGTLGLTEVPSAEPDAGEDPLDAEFVSPECAGAFVPDYYDAPEEPAG